MSNKQKQSLFAMEDISDLFNFTDKDHSIECEISLSNIQHDELDDPHSPEFSDEDDQPLSNYTKMASKQTNHGLKAAS